MASLLRCCPNCFRSVRAKALFTTATDRTSCPTCRAADAPLLPASNIAAPFLPLLEEYYEFRVNAEDFGDSTLPDCPLAEALENDGLNPFAPGIPGENQTAVLVELLRQGSARLKQSNADGIWPSVFSPRTAKGASPWDRIRDQIRLKSRYVVDWSSTHLVNLPRILSVSAPIYAAQVDQTTPLFRARVHDDDSRTRRLSAGDLHAPPPRLIQAARANPAGIRVLYVADSPETAIAEIRPHLDAVVSVAQIRPTKALRIFDFSQSPKMKVADPLADDIPAEIKIRAFMVLLDQAFAEPISPYVSERDYAPTQHVAELVASLGFEGIKYRSAMREKGFNYAFFNPDLLTPARHSVKRVTKIEISTASYDPNDPEGIWQGMFDEHPDPNDASDDK